MVIFSSVFKSQAIFLYLLTIQGMLGLKEFLVSMSLNTGLEMQQAASLFKT